MKDVLLKKEMYKQGSQGISQTGLSQNWIFPILDKASSLPSGWNFASSTTALKLFTIQW